MASLDSDLTELLQGARRLQATIQEDVHLPPVSRSLQQIEATASALAAAAQLDGVPASMNAQAFRFLATQGIDVSGLDPSALELAVGGLARRDVGTATTSDAWDGDVDKLLEREQQSALVQVMATHDASAHAH
eukprot:565974-Pleurochrysis_carterae.AAC.1